MDNYTTGVTGVGDEQMAVGDQADVGCATWVRNGDTREAVLVGFVLLLFRLIFFELLFALLRYHQGVDLQEGIYQPFFIIPLQKMLIFLEHYREVLFGKLGGLLPYTLLYCYPHVHRRLQTAQNSST